MFAKRQSALAATAGAPPSGRGPKFDVKAMVALLKKPPVAVGAAGLLLLGTVALFLTVLGDPSAGTPTARVALKREPRIEAPAPTGLEAFSMGGFAAWQGLGADPASDPSGAAGGDALITLPDGATVAGGSAIAAPVIPASP